jgi:hypothetical protein
MPFVLAPPHTAASPAGPAANARGYAKADSLVLPLQPLIVLLATGVVALCCH